MTVPRRPPPDAGWYPAAGALLLGGPVWAELVQSGYPLGNVEAIVLPLAGAAVGLVAALIAGRAREPLATLVFAALVLIFLDLQFNLERRVPMAVVAAVALVAGAALRRHRALLTAVSLAGFYLSLLPTAWRAEPPDATGSGAPSRLPVLLHVILDGQWGPSGMAAGGDSAAARDLERFYAERGFRLFRGAYSRYSATRLSLGSLASLDSAPPVRHTGGGRYQLTANPYFDSLMARGYRVRVFQSTHLDFCPPPRGDGPGGALACQAASSGSIGNVGHLAGRWQPRAVFTLRFLLGIRSHLYVRLLGPEPVELRRSAAGRAVTWAAQVRRAIAAGEGDAFFVHLILPHAPFEVDSACVGYPSVGRRLASNGPPTTPIGPRLAAYAGQSRCAHRVLDGLLATLDSAAGDQSIVVVHGDHGPKLVVPGRLLAEYSPAALTNYFSTLFAVRAPAIEPGAPSDPASIQELLARFVGSGFQEIGPGSAAPYVIAGPGSRDRDTVRVLAPGELPWAAPADSATDRPAPIRGSR